MLLHINLYTQQPPYWKLSQTEWIIKFQLNSMWFWRHVTAILCSMILFLRIEFVIFVKQLAESQDSNIIFSPRNFHQEKYLFCPSHFCCWYTMLLIKCLTCMPECFYTCGNNYNDASCVNYQTLWFKEVLFSLLFLPRGSIKYDIKSFRWSSNRMIYRTFSFKAD